MPKNISPEQEVIEIVEPLSEDSLQVPQQTQQDLTQQHGHKIIEEEEYTSKTETQPKPIKQDMRNESKLPDKKRKKIILYKCKICKTTGKKSTVKMCSKCKFHFHIECLDPDKIIDETKAFICQLCDKEATTIVAVKHSDHKSRLVQKIPNKSVQNNKVTQYSQEKQKPSCGFLNISKLNSVYQTNFKKQEWKRRLYQFYTKYPYCFQKNKIVFPIEDHLLHIYQSILPSYCKTTIPRPIPKFPNDEIPQKYYNELMEIQAFFFHFWEDLKTQNFYRPLNKTCKKQVKIDEMKRKNLYEKFKMQGVTQLYAWILEALLRIYLNDIMERNRIDNMKFISSNPFFNLLTIISEEEKGLSRQFIIKMAPQIIKNLAKAPSFKHSFYCDYEVQQHNHHQLQYPKHVSCENKIKVITKLIRGLCDTDCFKEIVIKKSQQISMLTKEKGEILQKLKSIENENIPLRESIRESESELKQLAFSDPKQYSKKYEPLNKRLEKLILTHKFNLQKIQQYREKLKEIAKKIPFVNSAVKFLGVDRFRSEYFFYRIDKGRIYVKFRQSFLCENENEKGYLCYESKEQVEKLKGWLNNKGANEKGLLFNINNLQQKELLDFSHHIPTSIIINNEEENRLYELQSITREENLETLIYCENLYKQTILNKEFLVEREKEMETLFQKLQFFGCQVASEETKIKVQTSELLEHNHLLRVLFSKYTSKILNWNEKVKRFWHQFLGIYTSSSHQQTQTNLHMIFTIWKLSMSAYHNQIIKKREKIQRKKERLLQNLKKWGIDNQLPGDEDDEEQQQNSQQQFTSQLEQNSTPYGPSQEYEGGMGRRLRKRQSRIKTGSKQSPTPQQSQLAYTSNKNQKSDHQMSDLQQQLSENVIIKTERNKKTNNKRSKQKSNNYLSKMDENESTNQKERKKSSKSKKKFPVIESKSPVQQYSQQQSKHPSRKQVEQHQLLLQYEQSQQLSPQEEFCEECFENVNYDSTAVKMKVVRCDLCSKVYHKKCLDEDDALRLKKCTNDSWKCADCSIQVQKHTNTIKNNKKSNSNNTQSEQPSQIILETAKIILKNEIQSNKNSKKKNKPNSQQKLETKKSKTTQKREKKQRKKKEQQIKSSQEVNSQSLEKSQEREEQQQRKKKTYKNDKTKTSNKKSSEEIGQNKDKKPSSNNIKQLSDNTYTSKKSLSTMERRSTREKTNRKKIIEPSSSEEEQQPNSEEQLLYSDEQIA